MGTWSEDKLKSLRSQYNFEKKTWSGNTPMVPPECELDSRGVLQWKGGKKPVVHSGYWVDPKKIAKDSSATDRRSRLHRALDCVLDSRSVAKDGLATDLTGQVAKARNKWIELGKGKGDDKYWVAYQNAKAALEAHRLAHPSQY